MTDDGTPNVVGSATPADGPGWYYVAQWLNCPANVTTTVPGDPERVLIAFYPGNTTGTTTIRPRLYPFASGSIPVVQNSNVWPEYRLSTHGPMVQDQWAVTPPLGAVFAVYMVTRVFRSTPRPGLE